MRYLLLLPFLLFACEGPQGDIGPQGEQGLQGQQGPAGPTGTATLPKGEITGAVKLRSEFGILESDYSGVTVSVDPTAQTTTTAADGTYRLSSVEAGTYQPTFSKAGYGTMRFYGFTHIGVPTPSYINTTLTRVSITVASALTASVSDGNLILTALASPVMPLNSTRFRYVRIFYAKNSNVSSTNYLESFYATAEQGGSGKATTIIPISILKEVIGLESGTTLYFVAHGSSASELPYYSPSTRSNVYPALNPTPTSVVSVVLP